MGMKITPEMMVEDEKWWHARDVVTELGYCGNEMRDRRNMTNADIRFYAYIMRKAHDLLKKEEPRVLTLEEAREALRHADFIVVEEPHASEIILGMRDTWRWRMTGGGYFHFQDLDAGSEGVDEYGKLYRFWTSRPTDDQRKAVKWNS